MKIKFDTVISLNTNCIKDTLIIYIIHQSFSWPLSADRGIQTVLIQPSNRNDDYNPCASSGSSILLDKKNNNMEIDWPAKLAWGYLTLLCLCMLALVFATSSKSYSNCVDPVYVVTLRVQSWVDSLPLGPFSDSFCVSGFHWDVEFFSGPESCWRARQQTSHPQLPQTQSPHLHQILQTWQRVRNRLFTLPNFFSVNF